ncbi:aldo/keto reductase [Chitinivorax sp. PXF-14]|uniref:aldo/keto reductase n=1 Tax=Chitinivorax sp. PXF-14 TaxID=3230488 RepID=UPI003465D5E4
MEQQFSRLILGSWRVRDWGRTPAELADFFSACADLGLTSIDFADIYGDYEAEAACGAAFALRPGLRRRLRFIGKCGIKLTSAKHPERRLNHYDTRRGHLIAAAEQTLINLGTDHLDTLLIHRPDPLMDADEVAEAFTVLQRAGKVRSFGVSNFTPSRLKLLQSRLPFRLVANQVEVSLLHVETLYDGTLDQCQRLGIVPQAWSPLGGGALFDDSPARAPLRAMLAQIGEELGGATPAQVALAWLLAHPARIHPIIGSGKLDSMRQAARALDLRLDREQWFLLLRAAVGHDVP